MAGDRKAGLETRVARGAATLRKRRLAEEAVRGAANARATGREAGLGMSPGEGDPVPPERPAPARKRAPKAKAVPPAGGFVHIDIPADDPERAARFYGTAFGWKTQALPGETPYWLLFPGGQPRATGVGAGIARRDRPGQPVVPMIEVPSAKTYARRIADAGGVIVAPATAIPGVGTLIVFQDTEGNVFGALEPGPVPFAPPPAEPVRKARRR